MHFRINLCTLCQLFSQPLSWQLRTFIIHFARTTRLSIAQPFQLLISFFFPGIFFRSLSNDLEKLEPLSFVCYLPAGIKSPSLVCRGNPCWCNSTLPDGRLCWLGFFYALRTKCSKFVPNCFTTNITRWQNSLLSTAWNPSWWENSPRVAHHHVKRSS